MFRLKKNCIILGVFISLIIGIASTSYAEEVPQRADMSNIEFEWVTYSNEDHNDLKLKVKNVNFIKNNTYYIHFSHNKDEQLSVTDYDSIDNDIWTTRIYGYGSEIFENPDEKLIGTFGNLDNLVAENGDIYIWICELDYNTHTPEILVKAKKVNRINQLQLGGGRINAVLDDISTRLSCYETNGENERKINVKIGIVSDDNVLKAIKNKENDSMQKLLNYSKTTKSTYDEKLPLRYSDSIIDSISLKDGQYYYVYLELDDENQKYFPVEDILFCQAHVSGSAKILVRYLDDSDFSWNLSVKDTKKEQSKTPGKEDKKTDKTTATNKLPNTGIKNIVIASFVLIISIILIIAKLKKIKGV